VSSTSPMLEPGALGALEVPNRIIRAATSESMAGPDGEVTDELVALHEALARGGVGVAFMGHMYCEERGRYSRTQTAIHSDETIPGLRRITDAVHRQGGRIFAQVAHAGSQSPLATIEPLAPSPVANVMTGRPVAEATEAEIATTIEAFAAAAGRAAEAGFDGVHIHGANGYLISEFRSPLANRRSDEWGGSAEARERFGVAVVRAVREALPPSLPVTMKLGFEDQVDEPGGLEVDDAVAGAGLLVEAGLDGIEVSSNLMSNYISSSIRPYVAVDRRRALADGLVHRIFKGPQPEAYFLPFARALRQRVETRIILVGGLRRTETMSAILEDGDADFISMARPLIREPDLVRKLEAGRTGLVECVSCNMCQMHENVHGLRCWRKPKWRIVPHAVHRLSGRLGHMPKLEES